MPEAFPYRLWPGSSKSLKPLTPNVVVPGIEVTHCLASQDTPSLLVREGLAGVSAKSTRSREAPQGTWTRVTQGPKSLSWRDLTPKVKGHRQGRAGRHRGSALMAAPERRGRRKAKENKAASKGSPS